MYNIHCYLITGTTAGKKEGDPPIQQFFSVTNEAYGHHHVPPSVNVQENVAYSTLHPPVYDTIDPTEENRSKI